MKLNLNFKQNIFQLNIIFAIIIIILVIVNINLQIKNSDLNNEIGKTKEFYSDNTKNYWYEIKQSNILIDYKVLKGELKKVLDYLDHEDINELPEFKGISPSSETLAKFIYGKMKEKISITSKVSVWETPTSCASYFEV